MCGLIGYVGDEQAAPILVGGLTRLEYRGYDSAGIATVNGRICLAKDIGKLENAMRNANFLSLQGQTGIGHVRWATHGGVTQRNAHPHCDTEQKIAVAHNGIIQNYKELKAWLSSKYNFQSETDTEVIPHLIRHFLDSGLSFEAAFFAAVKELKGSYAILAINKDEPNKIIAARNESPLVVGVGTKANYIGSDVLSFLPYTKKIISLNDGDVVILTKDSIKIYDINHKEIIKQIESVDANWHASDKGIYDHFMKKEIEEQPYALQQSLLQDSSTLMQIASEIKNAHRVVFIGCGTSRHAALLGEYAFSKIGFASSDVIMGSESTYFSDSMNSKTMVIAISQSGETADVLAGVRAAKKNGAKVLSIVNVVGSSLARESDRVLLLNCGPEIGVAATKSFIAQLSILYQLAFAMDNRLSEGQQKIETIINLLKSDINYLNKIIPTIAIKMKGERDFYFLARGVNFAVAAEGALKVKEISYVHAEGMPAGELKHGTLALIEDGTPVIAICPNDYTFDDSINNIMEAKARGAFVIGVSDISNPAFDDHICISKTDEIVYPFLTVVPLQLFAYYSAIVRGLDPDKPRNLAKSVTVK